MTDTKTVTPHWQFNVILSVGAIVLACFAPETWAGNLSQLVLICLVGFVMFQAGVLFQLESPRTILVVSRKFHAFCSVFLISLFLLAQDSGTRFLLGSLTAMSFFIIGDIWGFWQRQTKK